MNFQFPLFVEKRLLVKEMSCPHCGTIDEDYDGPDFYICSFCECLHGRGTLEESREFILTIITTEQTCLKRSVPFDIYCSVHSRGVIHRTGMYDPETLMITQVGPYNL